MSGKKIGGLIGMVVGGVWFAMNIRHVDEQGFVAIGMPLIIFIVGAVFFFKRS